MDIPKSKCLKMSREKSIMTRSKHQKGDFLRRYDLNLSPTHPKMSKFTKPLTEGEL